jgi:hypothetical protein
MTEIALQKHGQTLDLIGKDADQFAAECRIERRALLDDTMISIRTFCVSAFPSEFCATRVI